MRNRTQRETLAGDAAAKSADPALEDEQHALQFRDQEICRMAAFRIRETANRISTLANSARDEKLRSDLRNVCERLIQDERKLLELRTPLRG